LSQLQVANNELIQQYNVQTVDLSTTMEIPEVIDLLLIIDPKTHYNDSAKYAIDQFLMRGGKIALLAGKVKIDPTLQDLNARLASFGMDDMLEHWGIRINNDLVRDARCASIGIIRQQGQFRIQSQVQFPYFPLLTQFSAGNIITKDLKAVVLQFPSSIDTSLATSKKIKAEVLAYTSEASGRQTGMIAINPFQQYTESDFPEEFIPLAAVFSGSFKSFFAGKQPAAKLASSPETQIVVVGTGLFIEDNALTYRDNPVFFTNIIDYLSDDAGLISIRTKNVSVPPLEEVSDGTKKMLKYGNMIVPPLLVILFGLFRWRRRVSIKRTIEAQI
jgi:gliding-associated putative ABC transporter substrate-binding component GldG